jgi:hypothetical protein
MNTIHRTIGITVLALALTTCMNPLYGQVSGKPISFPFNDIACCACNGEEISISGSMLTIYTAKFDATGRLVHLDAHVNTQGVSGIGLVSGLKYQVMEVDNIVGNFKVGTEETTTMTMKLNAHGAAPNLTLMETGHITIDANGNLKIYFDKGRIECK